VKRFTLSELADSELVIVDEDGQAIVVVFVGQPTPDKGAYISVDVTPKAGHATARMFALNEKGVTCKSDVPLPRGSCPVYNLAFWTDWNEQ